MNRRIELGETDTEMPIVTVIKAQAIWKRLSKAAQEAVEAAYPDGVVRCHPLTANSLDRHGFIVGGLNGDLLSEAGKAIARWNVQVKP